MKHESSLGCTFGAPFIDFDSKCVVVAFAFNALLYATLDEFKIYKIIPWSMCTYCHIQKDDFST